LLLRCVWNLVVAALQRREDLGWLELEVKQDRLRGKVAGLVELLGRLSVACGHYTAAYYVRSR
jgi:hypothetical protein